MIILEKLDKAKFSTTDTHMSYYNDFLKPKELNYLQNHKNRTGEIFSMSPREYYKECAEEIFKKTLDYIIKSRKYNKETIDKYIKDMEEGHIFPLCVIDYADGTQEGLHRMMAAGEAFGWDINYPVLVVTAFDEELERQHKLMRDALDYFDYSFKYDLEKVQSAIQKSYNSFEDEPPEDLFTMFHEYIDDIAKGNVDFDISIDITRDYPIVIFTPKSYNGFDVTEYRTKSQELFLDDMFDCDDVDFENTKFY